MSFESCLEEILSLNQEVISNAREITDLKKQIKLLTNHLKDLKYKYEQDQIGLQEEFISLWNRHDKI